MAAPHVSGAIALLKSSNDDGPYSAHALSSLSDSAAAVANWTTGYYLVAIKEMTNGSRIVQLNYIPTSNGNIVNEIQ